MRFSYITIPPIYYIFRMYIFIGLIKYPLAAIECYCRATKCSSGGRIDRIDSCQRVVAAATGFSHRSRLAVETAPADWTRSSSAWALVCRRWATAIGSGWPGLRCTYDVARQCWAQRTTPRCEGRETSCVCQCETGSRSRRDSSCPDWVCSFARRWANALVWGSWRRGASCGRDLGKRSVPGDVRTRDDRMALGIIIAIY